MQHFKILKYIFKGQKKNKPWIGLLIPDTVLDFQYLPLRDFTFGKKDTGITIAKT